MVCKEYTISGIVQGVGFRWSTRDKADEIKITGTVRNNPNGSVSIFACGDEWQIEKIEKWLKNGGPKFAKIKNIDIKVVERDYLPTSFEII